MKNKKVITLIAVALVVVVILIISTKDSTDYLSHSGSFSGDPAELEEVVKLLPYAEILSSVDVKSENAPYDVVVSYNVRDIDNGVDDAFEAQLEKNAVVIMRLLDNVDSVKLRTEDIVSKAFSFERKRLEKTYAENGISLNTNEDIENFLWYGINKIKNP